MSDADRSLYEPVGSTDTDFLRAIRDRFGGLARLFTLPHDVMASRTPVTTGQMVPGATGLAALMVGTPGGAGGLGSGVRGFSFTRAEPMDFLERMAVGKDAAIARANKGQGSGGNLGVTRKTAPMAPKGSFQRLADETYARWQDHVRNALDELRRETGRAPEQNMLLAPGESAEDMVF